LEFLGEVGLHLVKGAADADAGPFGKAVDR
jgi:hypothetical protein